MESVPASHLTACTDVLEHPAGTLPPIPPLPPLNTSSLVPSPSIPSAAQQGLSAASAHSPPLGAALEPVLMAACENRLSAIHWFRSSWQRGGAATGYADYLTDTGIVPVVVKLPVPPDEFVWIQHLNEHGRDVAPKLYAGGLELQGYDLAWIVMERLPHGPLGAAWNGAEFDLIASAIARFYQASQHKPLTNPPAERDWNQALEQARANIVKHHDLPNEQRWKNALKACHKALPDWLKQWNARPQRDWCHGDLHLANAMTRQAAPHESPAILLDYALVHVGHWVEDAIYLEHLFWSRRQRLGGRKITKLISHQRKTLGLNVDADWPRYASLKRALLAMSTPAMLEADGQAQHVQAALEVLENELKIL